MTTRYHCWMNNWKEWRWRESLMKSLLHLVWNRAKFTANYKLQPKGKKNTLVCTNSLFCKLSRKLSHSILLVYCISPSKGPFTVTNLSVTSDQRPVTSDHWPATSYQWPTSILDSPAFKSLINNLPRYKIFHMWSAFAKNRRIAWKIWSMEDDFAILPTGFGKSWIFQLVAPYDDDLSSSRHDERPS